MRNTAKIAVYLCAQYLAGRSTRALHRAEYALKVAQERHTKVHTFLQIVHLRIFGNGDLLDRDGDENDLHEPTLQ